MYFVAAGRKLAQTAFIRASSLKRISNRIKENKILVKNRRRRRGRLKRREGMEIKGLRCEL